MTLRIALMAVVVAGCCHRSVSAREIKADVVYGHKDGLAMTFDVIIPDTPNGAGVISIISGGWYSGWAPPEVMLPASQPFLDAGFTVFILRHGSAPRYTVPEAVDDVRRAVRFIRAHAVDYQVDPDKLGAWGASAGGHLTLMLATTGDDGTAASPDPVLRESSRIAAGVSLCPPTDLRGWTTDPPEEIRKLPQLAPPLKFDTAKEPDVSPLLQVTADDAPVLMIHGDMDTLVPIEHSQKILPVFEKAGVASGLLTIEGVGHGFSPESRRQTIVPAMVKWFQKHLLDDSADR